MNLEPFYFPVEEREIALTGNHQPVDGYKAIVRPTEQGDIPISVVKNSYKLIPNDQLIEPFLDQIQSLNVNWYIDCSHTFASSNRMRLQITFPQLCLHDNESLIPLSLYLHNSYDMSEGVRVFFGAIRLVCSNGMVLGKILGSFYARHTRGFDFDRLAVEFDKAAEKVNTLQTRIGQLDNEGMTIDLYRSMQQALGKRRIADVLDPATALQRSQWDIYNRMTYHISHQVEKDRRADLQMKLSGVFDL